MGVAERRMGEGEGKLPDENCIVPFCHNDLAKILVLLVRRIILQLGYELVLKYEPKLAGNVWNTSRHTIL